MSSTPIQGEPKHQARAITSEGVTLNGSGYAKVNFDNGAITYYRKSKRWIKFQSYLKGTLFTPTARAIDNNTITYQGGKYFQAHYEWWDDSVKETITLKDAPQSQRFDLSDLSFLITTSDGTTVSQQANGDLWLVNEAGRCLMVIPMPTAVDADSVSYPVAWNYNTSTSFLTITGSITGANFPVTIDPSVELDSSTDANATIGIGRHICRDSAGRIWTAHFDDLDIEVNYSDDNGASFTSEEPVVMSKVTTYGLAIAVDSNRDVHLVYNYEDTASNTTFWKYVKRTHSSSTWGSITDIRSGGAMGQYYSPIVLVIRSNNYPAVSFIMGGNQYFYYWNGSSWSYHSQSGNYDTKTDISCDRSDNLDAVYLDGADGYIKYVKVTIGTGVGTPQTVSTSGSSPSIATGSDGYLHVIYYRNLEILYKKYTTSWGSEEVIATVSEARQPSINLTQADVPIVTYPYSSYYIYYTTKQAAGWSTPDQFGYTNGGPNFDETSCWATNPRCSTANPSNTHIDGAILMGTTVVSGKYYTYFTKGDYFQPANTCQTVYSCGVESNAGANLGDCQGRQIARDSTGKIWILWKTTTTNLLAKYSSDGGKTWTQTEVYASTSIHDFALAIDSNNNVHVAYCLYVTSYYEVKYIRWNGSSWDSSESVTSGSSQDQTEVAIDVDSSNYPHITWIDGRYSKYRYKTSGGWQSPVTIFDAGSGYWCVYQDMAINSSNQPIVVLCYTAASPAYGTKCLRWNGSSFDTLLTSTGANSQYSPSVAVYSGGSNFVVGWITNGVGTCHKYTGTMTDITSGLGSTLTNLSLSVDQDDSIYALYRKVSLYDVAFKKYISSWSSETDITNLYGSIASYEPCLLHKYSSNKSSLADTGAMGIFLAEAISTAFYGVCVWKSSDLTWSAGGTLNYKSVTGTMTAARSLVKRPKKRVVGTEVAARSLRRRVGKRVTKAEVAVGSVRRRIRKTLTKAMVGVVSLLKTKISFKTLTAVSTAARSLTKRAGKRISGTETGSGSLSKLSRFKKTITRAETAVGSLIKRSTKKITGTEVASGSVRKRALKRVVGSVTGIGSILYKKVIGKLISGTETAVGSVRRRVGKRVVGTETGSGSLSKLSRFKKTLTAAETAVGTLRKRVLKRLSQVVTGVVSLARQQKQTFTKTLTGAMNGATSLRRIVGKRVLGLETGVATLSKSLKLSKIITGVETAVGSVRRKVGKRVSAVETSVGSLRRRIGKILRVSKNLLSSNVASGTDILHDLSGFTARNGATLSSSNEQAWQGQQSLKIVTPGGGAEQGAQILNFTNIGVGQTYTISCYLRGTVGTEFIALRFRDNLGGEVLQSNAIGTDWSSRWEVTRTIPAGVTSVYFQIETGSSQAVTFYVDGIQFEMGASASTWEMPSATGIPNLSRKVGKRVSGVVTGVGAIIRKISKTLSQVVTGIANLGKTAAGKFYQTITTSMVGVGSLSKRLSLSKTLSAVETAVGSVIKRIRKNITGSETAIGTLRKRIGKTLTKAVVGVASLLYKKLIGKIITGTMNGVTSLRRRTGKIVTTIENGIGSLSRKASFKKTLTAVETAARTLVKSVRKRVVGTETGVGTLRKSSRKILSAVEVAARTLRKRVLKRVSGIETAVGSLLRRLSLTKTLTATETAIGSIQRRITKKITGTMIGVVSLWYSTAARWYKTLSTTAVGTTSAIKRKVGKFVSGSEVASGAIRKRITKKITQIETAIGILGKGQRKTLTAIAVSSASLRRRVGKIITKAEVATGSLRRRVGKRVSGIEQAVGSIRRRITKTISQAVQAIGLLFEGGYVRKYYQTLSTVAQVNPILRAGKRFLKTLSTTVSAIARLWHDYFAGGYTEQRACVLLTCNFDPYQNLTCNFDPNTILDCDFDTPPTVYLQCSLKCVR